MSDAIQEQGGDGHHGTERLDRPEGDGSTHKGRGIEKCKTTVCCKEDGKGEHYGNRRRSNSGSTSDAFLRAKGPADTVSDSWQLCFEQQEVI